MPIFVMIAKHDAADCAFFNEKSAKTLAEYASKLPELLAKHDIKIVGACTVNNEHLVVPKVESQSALEALSIQSADLRVTSVFL